MSNLTIVDLVDDNFNLRPQLFDIENFVLPKEGRQIDYYGFDEGFMGFFVSLRTSYGSNMKIGFSAGGLDMSSLKYHKLIDKAFLDGMGGSSFNDFSDFKERRKSLPVDIDYAIKSGNAENLFSLTNESFRCAKIFFCFRPFKSYFSNPKTKVNYFLKSKVYSEIKDFKMCVKENKQDKIDGKKFSEYLMGVYGLKHLL